MTLREAPNARKRRKTPGAPRLASLLFSERYGQARRSRKRFLLHLRRIFRKFWHFSLIFGLVPLPYGDFDNPFGAFCRSQFPRKIRSLGRMARAEPRAGDDLYTNKRTGWPRNFLLTGENFQV
jgi:hypothetical protein